MSNGHSVLSESVLTALAILKGKIRKSGRNILAVGARGGEPPAPGSLFKLALDYTWEALEKGPPVPFAIGEISDIQSIATDRYVARDLFDYATRRLHSVMPSSPAYLQKKGGETVESDWPCSKLQGYCMVSAYVVEEVLNKLFKEYLIKSVHVVRSSAGPGQMTEHYFTVAARRRRKDDGSIDYDARDTSAAGALIIDLTWAQFIDSSQTLIKTVQGLGIAGTLADLKDREKYRDFNDLIQDPDSRTKMVARYTTGIGALEDANYECWAGKKAASHTGQR
jgi:hypothetical protein